MKTPESASITAMRFRALGLGMLLAGITACSDTPGPDAFREKSAREGHRRYQNEMGIYQQKIGHYAQALNWYLAAAAPTNHVIASGETKVDVISRYGTFMKLLKKEPANAELNFNALEEGSTVVVPGLPDAMYNAGAIYERAVQDGFLKDLGIDSPVEAKRQAVKWYRHSAGTGLEIAQFAYGHALEHGIGGLDVDLKNAGSWYERSAKQGFADAQNNLGNLHFLGFGDNEKRNYAEAYYWFSVCANNMESNQEDPPKDLVQAINACRKSLTNSDIQRMDRLINSFQPIKEE